jgi:hypothetical protein
MKKTILNLGALAVIFLGAGNLLAAESELEPEPGFGVAPHCCSGGGITCCGKNGCSETDYGCSYW